MTTNNLLVLARTRSMSRLLIADRDPNESAIATRAIERRCPRLEIRSANTLAAAAKILSQERIETILAGSGLDGWTLAKTIDWFARSAPGAAIIALLQQPDDRHRQEALEAGARDVRSKPDLLVAQLRHELGSRLSAWAPERPLRIDCGSPPASFAPS
jgi:CheY-like chemotaxis protein